MKSNIVKAAINFACIPCPKVLEFYKETGRATDINEAVTGYVKDLFAGTVREEDKAKREKKFSQIFDPDAKDYPQMAIGGGDGDVIIFNVLSSKDEDVTYPSHIETNFEYDEDNEKYIPSTDAEQNKALYINAVTDGENLKGLYMIYGELYRALAGDGETVKNVVKACEKQFESLDCKFEAFALIPKDYYETLHKQNRLEIEALVPSGRIYTKEMDVNGIEAIIYYIQM